MPRTDLVEFNDVIITLPRLRKHMSKCPKLPSSKYEMYGVQVRLGGHGKNRERQARLSEETFRINNADSEKATLLLAEAIYSSGVPFSFVSMSSLSGVAKLTEMPQVENPAFVRFLKLLRPAYKPPSRTAIATTLLDSIYDQTKQDMKHVLQKAGRQLTL
ncbi:hypothetical protein BU23DRAFT_551853, partial [Bimuria novae-zelandiae CBS 107.79]